jgi:hypothetical protein
MAGPGEIQSQGPELVDRLAEVVAQHALQGAAGRLFGELLDAQREPELRIHQGGERPAEVFQRFAVCFRYQRRRGHHPGFPLSSIERGEA